MRAIVNNLRQYNHSQSASHSEVEQGTRIRSLSRRSKDEPGRQIINSSLRKLPRTQQPAYRPRNSLLASSSSLFYEPKGINEYRRITAAQTTDLKKDLASTQYSKVLSRTSGLKQQPCIVKPMDQPLPIKPRQENGHTNELWKLRVNDLFFCVECYRYVFRIQFDYHYPSCKSPISLDLPLRERKELGLCRLRLIKQLLEMLAPPEKSELLTRLQEMKEGRLPSPPFRDRRSGYFYLTSDVGGALNLIWLELLN